MKFFVVLAAGLAPLVSAGQVRLYENANYGTQIFEAIVKPLACNNVPFTKHQDGNWKVWDVNDRTSSIQINDGVTCRFWDSANCADVNYLQVTGYTPWVGKDWNDKISSFSCFA